MDYALNFNEVGDIIRSIDPSIRFRVETYDYINGFRDIDSLMSDLDSLVILYRIAPTYGHFTVLTKCDTKEYRAYIKETWNKETTLPVYCFCDSYGLMVDKELSFAPKRLRAMLGESWPKLRDMLISCPNVVEYNTHKLQGKNSSTCGRYASVRAAMYKVPLEIWVERLFKGKTPDNVILAMTANTIGAGDISGGKRMKSLVQKTGVSQIVNVNVEVGKRTKRQKRTATGNVLITLPKKGVPKAMAEKPLLVDDERYNYVNPYASRELRIIPPREVLRPQQTVLQPSQTHFIQHHANGVESTNLQLASAITKLSSMIPSLKQGEMLYKAERDKVKLFLDQSSQIGGASPTLHSISTETISRQAAFMDAYLRQSAAVAASSTRPPPEVSTTAWNQIVAADQETNTANIMSENEQTVQLGPVQTLPVNSQLPITYVKLQGPNLQRATAMPRFGYPQQETGSQMLTAFPTLGRQSRHLVPPVTFPKREPIDSLGDIPVDPANDEESEDGRGLKMRKSRKTKRKTKRG